MYGSKRHRRRLLFGKCAACNNSLSRSILPILNGNLRLFERNYRRLLALTGLLCLLQPGLGRHRETLAMKRRSLQPGLNRHKETLAATQRFLQPGFDKREKALASLRYFLQPGLGRREETLAAMRHFLQPGFRQKNRPWLARVVSRSQGSPERA